MTYWANNTNPTLGRLELYGASYAPRAQKVSAWKLVVGSLARSIAGSFLAFAVLANAVRAPFAEFLRK